MGADIYLIIYRRRRIRFAIRCWSRLGENGISCCLFLHQTTTRRRNRTIRLSCISFVSYIKPQPLLTMLIITPRCISFVSYIKPQQKRTSIQTMACCISFVSYIKPQLSNHRFPTNHSCISFVSYIKPQLFAVRRCRAASCISFVSYIKPQPFGGWARDIYVVYRSFPTSNHNRRPNYCSLNGLYIVRFLHQTTTCSHHSRGRDRLYIVRFLHQTTTK